MLAGETKVDAITGDWLSEVDRTGNLRFLATFVNFRTSSTSRLAG